MAAINPNSGHINKLMELLQVELRRIAGRELAREAVSHTLQPTALVNEAYLKLIQQYNLKDVSRTTFLAAAGGTIRRILIDHARAKRAEKRGGRRARVTLSDLDAPEGASELELLELNDAIEKLAQLNPRIASVVELRYFAGLNVDEAAQALNVTTRTITRDWVFARAWLKREMGMPVNESSD